MDYDEKRNRAFRNAKASLLMEGFPVTDTIEKVARKLADGKISVDECAKALLTGRSKKER